MIWLNSFIACHSKRINAVCMPYRLCMLLVNLRANIFSFAVSEIFSRVLEASDSHKQLSDIKKVCGDHVH